MDSNPIPNDPVSSVKWVPVEKVKANDYNPNAVAKNELYLLYISILHDGFTQPCVTVYDPEEDQWIIVDGFHRYYILITHKDIYERTQGRLPIVVLEKSINDRMASTVRHNRARGKHSVAGMASMVFSLLDNGWSDSEISSELGMEVDELMRLKYVTGFAKLFDNIEYSQAWETRSQLRLKRKHANEEEVVVGADND